MYIANHYVRIGKTVYLKGEVIPENMPAEKINWLVKTGAIHREEAPVSMQEEPAEMIENQEEERLENTEAMQQPDEPDPEEEAPDIDVMAGIVQQQPEAPTETPKKPGSKKRAERRKAT